MNSISKFLIAFFLTVFPFSVIADVPPIDEKGIEILQCQSKLFGVQTTHQIAEEIFKKASQPFMPFFVENAQCYANQSALEILANADHVKLANFFWVSDLVDNDNTLVSDFVQNTLEVSYDNKGVKEMSIIRPVPKPVQSNVSTFINRR